MSDNINKPSHYRQHPSGVESIQVAELGGFTLGNAIKYLFRWPYKGQAVDDLKKARFYLQRFNATDANRLHRGQPYDPEEIENIDKTLAHEPPATALWHALTALEMVLTGQVGYDKDIALAIHAIEEELNKLEENNG